MAKKSKKAFVDAVKAKGGVRYFDLGGGVDLAPAATPLMDASANVTNGSLAGAVTPQSTYNAKLAPTTNLNYSPVVAGAANNALGATPAFNQNLTAQQALLQQLIAQGNGQGPNPAQAALAEATGHNVANTAAGMANVRGGSNNAGLIARQAGQAGAATQQQAAGQAATLQAQQTLGAQQAAGQLAGQVGSQIVGKQAADTSLFGTGAGAANTQNANLVTNYGNTQGINAGTAAKNAEATQKTQGGILNGLSAIASLFAEGGEVEAPAVAAPSPGAQSIVGKFLASAFSPAQEPEKGPDVGSMIKSAAPAVMAASDGKVVPGKAKVGGDSLKNDNVPAMLSPGEIVLPRSVVNAADAPARAAAFVRAIQAKQGLKRGKK